LAPGRGIARAQSANADVQCRRIDSSNDYVWEEIDRTKSFPVEPDALFTLRFSNRSAGEESVHFIYEADRGSMPMAEMLKKLRAHYQFIKRLQKHRDAFGVHPIRAVLIETTDEARARRLMELVRQPVVVGNNTRCSLFWFAISPQFADPNRSINGRHCACYLSRPEIVLDPLWATPDLSLHTLGDAENFPSERPEPH
jgi:hypothetical protein